MDYSNVHAILEQLAEQVKHASDECADHAAPINSLFESRKIALMGDIDLQCEIRSLPKTIEEHDARTKQLDAVLIELTQTASGLRDIVWARTQMAEAMRARRKALVLNQGLFRTPDEIMAQILEEASERNVKALGKISQVCQRFSNVISGAPSLWTRISSRTPLEMSRKFLSRSGVCLLDVEVDASHSSSASEEALTDFMRFIVEHSRRWRSFTLVPNGKSLQVVFPYLQNIEVPKLETFNLNPAVNSKDLSLPQDEEILSLKIFQAGAPRLRHLHSSLYALDPRSFSDSISSLTVRYEAWEYRTTNPSLSILSSILCGLPNLVRLGIEFFDNVWFRFGETHMSDLSMTTLYKLEELHIKMSGNSFFDESIPRHLTCPNLETLSLEFNDAGGTYRLQQMLLAFAEPHHDYSHLRSFKFVLEDNEKPLHIPSHDEEKGIRKLLRRMKKLSKAEFHGIITTPTLELFKGDTGDDDNTSRITFPSLETLVIAGYERVKEGELLRVLRSRIGTENVTPIRHLVVSPFPSKNFLVKVKDIGDPFVEGI